MPLETVDLLGVNIASAGGPYHGFGSAEGGDYLTEQDLAKIVADTNEVIDEIRPVAKLGHNEEQELVRKSSLFAGDDMPALGWWRNFRVEGGKVLADAMRVPAKFAELIKAGAYPLRSWETKRFTSQKTGKAYDEVISGVGWHGERPVAIKTLDDVFALYGDASDAESIVHVYASEPSDDPAGLTREQVEQIKGLLGVSDEPADTGGQMPDDQNTQPETPETQPEPFLTLEQARELGPALGLSEDFTLDDFVAAIREVEMVEETILETPEAEVATEPETQPEAEATPEPALVGALSDAEVYQLRRDAAAGREAYKELKKMEHDRLIEDAMRDGRFSSAQEDHYRSLLAANEPIARKVIEGLEPRREYAEVYGRDDQVETQQGLPELAAALDQMIPD